MPHAATLHPMRLLAAACLCMLLAAGARAQDLRLGTVAFPTSARSPEAQEHFRRGVAALHSFWSRSRSRSSARPPGPSRTS